MSTFDDIELEWKGRTFVMPAIRAMGAIARIEDFITLAELQRYGEKATVPWPNSP